jgi:hypothetical protein
MTEKEKIWFASLSVATIGLATLIILYRREIKSGIISLLSSFKKSILDALAVPGTPAINLTPA